MAGRRLATDKAVASKGEGAFCADFCVWAWYFNSGCIMPDFNKIILEDGSIAVRLAKIERRLDRLERVDRKALERLDAWEKNGYKNKQEKT